MGSKKTEKVAGKKAAKKRTSKSGGIPSKAKSGTGRVEHRVPINLLVDYRSSGNYLFDFCKDLGTGGVFIQTNSPLPTGSTIDLTFTIPDSQETLNTSGEVIWVQDRVSGRSDLTPGMGVQFSGFGDEKRLLLEDFVSRYHSNNKVTNIRNSSNKQSA